MGVLVVVHLVGLVVVHMGVLLRVIGENMQINFNRELFDWILDQAEKNDMPAKSYIVKNLEQQMKLSQQGDVNDRKERINTLCSTV